MKKIFGIFALLFFSQLNLAKAENNVIIVNTDNAPPGQYYLIVTVDSNGNNVVKSLNVKDIIILKDGTSPPGDPLPPIPTGSFGDKVLQWAKEINDHSTANKLALAYEILAEQIKSGALKNATLNQIAEAAKFTRAELITDKAKWKPFEDKLIAELTKLHLEGKLANKDAYYQNFLETSAGLKASVPLDSQNFTIPTWLKEILLKLILEIITKLLGG